MAMTDDSSLRVVQQPLSSSAASSRSRSRSPQPPIQPPTSPRQQSHRPPSSTTSYAFSAPYPMAPPPTSPRHQPSNGITDPTSSFQVPRYNFPPNLVPVQPPSGGPAPRRQSSLRSPFHSPSQEYTTPRIPYPSSSNGSISRVTETHHITKDYDHRTGAKTINRYEFHETIGRGVHGKVKLARDIETGELVAIKIVTRVTKKRLGRMDPLEAENKVRREIAIMKKCAHANVVALREVMDDPTSKKIYLGIGPDYHVSNL